MPFRPSRRQRNYFCFNRFAAAICNPTLLFGLLLGLAGASLAPVCVKADPPPWAPAHGYWRHHDHDHDHVWIYQPEFVFDDWQILDHEYGAESDDDHGRSVFCREYSSVAVIGGVEQDIFGLACRQPDGSWQIMG